MLETEFERPSRCRIASMMSQRKPLPGAAVAPGHPRAPGSQAAAHRMFSLPEHGFAALSCLLSSQGQNTKSELGTILQFVISGSARVLSPPTSFLSSKGSF